RPNARRSAHGTVESSIGRRSWMASAAAIITPRPSTAGMTNWTAGLYQPGIPSRISPRRLSWTEPAWVCVSELTDVSYVLQKQNATPIGLKNVEEREDW